MKVLFLIFHGFSNHSGISKKIHGQVKGMRENGAQVDLMNFDVNDSGERCWKIDKEIIVSLGSGLLGKIRKRICFGGLKDYITSQKYDLIYIRSFHNANPFTINLVKNIRTNGTKVVIEIPTYPYDQEYQSWRIKPELFLDRIFRRKLMNNVDAVVTFSEDNEIFGQRAIQISNGINFEAIPLRRENHKNKEIHLLGVAEIHYWHGFDRLVRGLGEYYSHNPQKKVYFHLVGEYFGSRERREIEDSIAQFGLQDYVIIHGALFGKELDKLFDTCDFAIGSLGRHRTGISRMRSLKNREYAARGIPFCYSESDPDFDNKDYIIRFSADESAIDIFRILEYLDKNDFSAVAIQNTVSNLSWRNQMKIVFDKVFN